MWATLSKVYAAHGTKLLGVLVTVVGAAGESLQLIQAVDPKHAALWALVITVGGAIIKRGYTNTAVTQTHLEAAGWTPPPPK